MDASTVKTLNSVSVPSRGKGEGGLKETAQYLSGVLYKEYILTASARMKPVMSVDDLVRVFHHHWVLDMSTFADERQRVQLSMLLLLAAYTGQRPCSILETARDSKTEKLHGDGMVIKAKKM